jgi:hypothetical protein
MTDPIAKINNLKTNLATLLKEKLAQGNNKEAWINEIKMDKAKIFVSATLRHHQVWNSPFIGKISTYDITTPFNLAINPTDMSVDGNLCIDLPPIVGGGKVCITAQEIRGLIG